MTRTAGTVFASILLLSGAAHAAPEATTADLQLVVADTTPQAVHAKVVQAARTVCDAAIKSDPTGEFGTRDECIDNTVRDARLIEASYHPDR